MSVTKVNLDRQTIGKNLMLGTTSANGEALLTINNGTESVDNVVLNVRGSGTFSGDVNILGDLNITGNINQEDVTNLQVTDKTITVNKGGTTSGASGAGLLIEGDSANVVGQIAFDNTKASKFVIGGASPREIADVSSNQTFSNKILYQPTIDDLTNANHDHRDAVGGGTLTDASLASAVGVAKGGTGLTTLTSNAVILGNGASSPTFVSPGASGNVLTSNGSTWVSTTPSSGATFGATTVSGTQDGSNKSYTTGDNLASGSEQVFLNGQLLAPGASNDYTLSGKNLVFTSVFDAPEATDVIRVYGVY